MKLHLLYWLLIPLLIGTLSFGCGRKLGEKLYHEAQSEWAAGNLVRARTLLEKSIRRRAGSLENADAYNQLGVLLWEMKNPKEAIDAFNESYRLNPNSYDVLCNLGVALSTQTNVSAVAEVFGEAALLQPKDPRPAGFVGIVYTKNQQWTEAARNLSFALEQTPDSPQLQTALALTELHTGKAEVALNRLQSVAKQHPTYMPALYNIAAIYRHWFKNQPESTLWMNRYLRQTSSNDPFAAPFRTQRSLEQTGGSKILFNRPSTPDHVAAEKHFQAALTYHKKNDLNRATQEYIKTLEANDLHEQAFYNLGLTYYAAKKFELAAEAFSQTLQLNPSSTSARYNSALAEYCLGNNARAKQSLEIILRQQPNYQPAIDLMKRLKTK